MAVRFFPNILPWETIFGQDSDISAHVSRKSFWYTAGSNVHPLTARLIFRNSHDKGAEKKLAILRAFVSSLQGGVDSCYFPDHFYVLRGSFSAPELLTNPTFETGTTGWTSGMVATVSDRVYRGTVDVVDGVNTKLLLERQAAAAVQYAPYALRCFYINGRGSLQRRLLAGSTSFSGNYLAGTSTANQGLDTAVFVPPGTTVFAGVQLLSISSITPGDFVEVAYISLARVPLVDGGGNALLRSIEFDNAIWTKVAVTVSAEAFTAPDGSDDGDAITETIADSTHEVQQAVTVAAAAADFFFGVAVHAGLRTLVQLVITEATGATSATAFFNLSAVTVGTTAAGVNWSNTRAFIRNLGNGWFYCGVVSRKTNAATSLNHRILAATAGEVNSYVGSAAAIALYVWRATASASSVPARLVQTITAAVAASAQSGAGVHLKGLPASTNGLAMKGDLGQIGNELKLFDASLNSDAAGLGYAVSSTPMTTPPADNEPVIFTNPMAKWRLVSTRVGWSNKAGGFSDLEFDFIQDLSP